MQEHAVKTEFVGFYALMWRLVHLSVHRYGVRPTGQLLMGLVVVLLDEVGYQPTLSEVAELVALPKSTVSRYVSSQMADGVLEEYIDPEDRRRRRLRWLPAALAERTWHFRQVREIHDRMRELISAGTLPDIEAEKLVSLLRSFGEEGVPEHFDASRFRHDELPPDGRTATSSIAQPDPEVGLTYAVLWRFLDHTVHRYGSQPSGELLVVLTVLLLDVVDYYPTVSELAELVGLPKSTVSRYCSNQIGVGFLAEVIDPDDRRLRRLRLSAHSRDERNWHEAQMVEMRDQTAATVAGLKPPSEYPPEQLLQIMREFTSARPDRVRR